MKDIHIQNRNRCIAAMIICLLVFLTSAISVLIVVSSYGDYLYVGLENLRYFTYQSNIFVGLCAFLCIPFQIDGLRNDNYHLPRWIVNMMFISVCTVTITFLLATVLILPFSGFYLTYVLNCSFLPHLFTPLLSIAMFIYINDDHELKKNMLPCSLIPLGIYAFIYITEVFGKESWIDHYHIDGIIPVYLSVPLIIVFYFIIATVLRRLHNIRHALAKKQIKEYYMNSNEVSYSTIEEAISNLAIRNRKYDRGGDIVVPRRIIILMEEKYQSGRSIDELCAYYLKEMFKS